MNVMNKESLSMVCGAGGVFGGIGALNAGIGAVTGAATNSDYDHLGAPVYGSAGVSSFCKRNANANTYDGSQDAWKGESKDLYQKCMADPTVFGYKR
ncbi:hypothetical protein FNJ09_22615 [Salmonella enterica subsp. salamae]|nr:hypothetical protein [Salmonella enterica subsp. salamae]